MSEAVSIHQAATGDELALSLVGQSTFLETFAGILSGRDILLHCANQHAVEKYRAWLAEELTNIWLASLAPGRAPIGYLVMTKPDLPLPDVGPRDVEVKRIYLLEKFQGRGIGRRLMAEAASRAASLGKRRLLLGVYSRNLPAIRFYEKSGFKRIGERRFNVGENTFDDYVFALEL
jgi:ribosomal protein S18 acetylase RimI-like enzyme